jgi:hypothetical protein
MFLKDATINTIGETLSILSGALFNLIEENTALATNGTPVGSNLG